MSRGGRVRLIAALLMAHLSSIVVTPKNLSFTSARVKKLEG